MHRTTLCQIANNFLQAAGDMQSVTLYQKCHHGHCREIFCLPTSGVHRPNFLQFKFSDFIEVPRSADLKLLSKPRICLQCFSTHDGARLAVLAVSLPILSRISWKESEFSYILFRLLYNPRIIVSSRFNVKMGFFFRKTWAVWFCATAR